MKLGKLEISGSKAESLLAVLRYGSGLPLHRIARLQAAMGALLAASTAWDVLEKSADRIHPVFPELIRQAAQADIVHNDATNMKILNLMALQKNSSALFANPLRWLLWNYTEKFTSPV